MSADLILRARGLRKGYGDVVAVDNVDLDIQPGEIVGLLGHNGAGKTTLVSMVAGLRKRDAGTVEVDGVDADVDPVGLRQRLGLAPQETGVYPDATVADNLRVFGALAGLGGARLRSAIEETASAFGLDTVMDRTPAELSGGQRRRVHTASAVLHRPPLLLLDEPTVGADVTTRDALLELVRGLASEGAGVCYSTHYLPEVESLGASVAVLHGGRLLARGSVDELVEAHSRSAVELVFDGGAPPLPGADARGGIARVPTRDPAKVAAELLFGLSGEARGRLRSIELIRDDLESVYRALTGEEVSAPENDMKEAA